MNYFRVQTDAASLMPIRLGVYQRIVEVMDPETGEPTANSRRWLRAAFFGRAAPSCLVKAPVGQFFPGAAGGANGTSGFDAPSGVNPSAMMAPCLCQKSNRSGCEEVAQAWLRFQPRRPVCKILWPHHHQGTGREKIAFPDARDSIVMS